MTENTPAPAVLECGCARVAVARETGHEARHLAQLPAPVAAYLGQLGPAEGGPIAELRAKLHAIAVEEGGDRLECGHEDLGFSECGVCGESGTEAEGTPEFADESLLPFATTGQASREFHEELAEAEEGEEEDPCDRCGSRVLHEECDERDLDDYNAADEDEADYS